MILGPVERHYLKCPVCPGRASLETHRCPGCGAVAVAVEWQPAGPVSPELVAVSLTDNLRAGSMTDRREPRKVSERGCWA